MDSTVIVGILSFCGSLLATVGGIFINNKLTIYRIDRLEEHVNKHNNLIDRMYKVENRVTLLEEIKEE